MLLRSITKHVKDQNWFAVFLDFAIVVLGILMAFWINAMADQKSKEDELIKALISVKKEIETNLELIETTRKRHESVILAGQSLLNWIDSSERGSFSIDELSRVFFYAVSSHYPRGSIIALIDSDRMDYIDNPELKAAIASLPAIFDDATEDEVIVFELVDGQWVPYISRHLPVGPFWESTNSDDNSGKISEVIELNQYEFVESLEFRNHIENRIGYQQLVISEQALLKTALEQTLELIDHKLR